MAKSPTPSYTGVPVEAPPEALAPMPAPPLVPGWTPRARPAAASPPPLPVLDPDRIAPDVAAELLRLGELRHRAQMDASLAMDSRASVLSAAFIAAAAVIVGVGAGLFTTARFLLWPSVLVVVLLCLASVLCAAAARPQPFRFPGMDPASWESQTFLVQDLRTLQLARARDLQVELTVNRAQQGRSGFLLRLGVGVAAAAPILAGLLAVILTR